MHIRKKMVIESLETSKTFQNPVPHQDGLNERNGMPYQEEFILELRSSM